MITWFNQLLSYFKPVALARERSAISGELEVTIEQGRLLLNATNVNYSGGSLYDVFEQVFEELDLKRVMFNSALILGYGTGCTLKLLLRHPDLHVIGVELDPVVIEIGKQYFRQSENNYVTVIQEDAFIFISNTDKQFEIILVDVFVGDVVPQEGSSLDFWKNLRRSLFPKGYCLVNWMPTTQKSRNRLNSCLLYARELFSSVQTIYCLDNVIIACRP